MKTINSISLSLALLLCSITVTASIPVSDNDRFWPKRDNYLTIDQIGPSNMPKEIEPVDAPFPMSHFQCPKWGNRTFKVKMKPKGMSTQRIQRAIDKISKEGGGTVIIPPGTWHTGRIELKSGVNLHLEEGAVLSFSGKIADYLPAVFTRDEGVEVYSLGACIYSKDQHDIALTGKGIVRGPSTDCEIYKNNSGLEIDKQIGLSLKQRVFNGQKGTKVCLPKTFSPIKCKNIFVEGITFENGLYWNIVPQYCDHVIIRGITVKSHGHGRTDGIDIDSSHDVLIEYCSLDCQDDCYTMKSGRGVDGMRVNIPTENVVIRKCIALRGAGGIVCGSETAGGIRNVYMTDCVFEGTDQAFRFKTRRPRGGFLENIYVERIKANVLREALYCDMLGSRRWAGTLADRYPAQKLTKKTPWFRNISIHDVEITNCNTLINVGGLPEIPVKNLFFGNVKARCKRLGSIRDVTNFSMKDLRVTTGDSVLVIDNCDYASFFGCSNVLNDQPIVICKRGGENRYLNIQNYSLKPIHYNSIKPGTIWLDTEGKPIQAHGFQVTYINGKYYWYGEDKTATLFGTNWMFGGVRCYSSTDFYNWKDEGRIVLPSEDPASPLHHSQKLERPHILYCAKTRQYVCWLKAQSNAGYFVILQSEDFLGPYHYVRSIKPNGFAVGDFDMYTDETTGKAYVWFERPHNEMICSELSDDYLNVNGKYSEHFVGKTPPFAREAPAHFTLDGKKHYLFTSGTTGYMPNPTEVAVFDDFHGDYEVLGNPHINDKYNHSFCSQITSVIKIPGKNLYVAMADRWRPHATNTDLPRQEWLSFKKRYVNHKPEPRDFADPKPANRYYTLVNPNQDTYKSTYVFLPIKMVNGIPTIEWHNEWRIEDF
ncbi:MAG: glycosyl hydrolase family 28 protein [Prevotella sp.]|jgi:polygalacturonase